MTALTFAQQRIWRLTQAGVPHLITTSRRWSGPLDREAFTAALASVVKRHDALRLAIAADGSSQALQQPGHGSALEVADLTALRSETAARQWAEDFLRRPFQLGQAPLLRVGLAKLADDDYSVLFAAHHLVCDATSLALVRREVLSAYRSHPGDGGPSASFLDYAAGQAGRVGGDADRDYWKRQLAGVPAFVTLPPDFARQAEPCLDGGRVTLELPRELGSALAETVRRERCTTFILIQAALAIVLSRHSGQSTVVIGAPADHRERPELERAVGMYTGVLALRTDLCAGLTFRELLRNVRSATLGGIQHQRMPFDDVASIVNSHAAINPHPVFQVLLVTDPAPPEPEQPWAGVRIAAWHKPAPVGPFDLTVLYASHVPKLYAHFSSCLYQPATVERFLSDLAQVLKAFTGDLSLRLPS